MILPFRDDNPIHSTPYLTYSIIGLCVLIFLYQSGLGEQARQFIFTYGFMPGNFFNGMPRTGVEEIAPSLTLITSMFLHGDFMHLAGNMLYLWIFADNIEHILGRTRFAIFYLLCGVAAALSHGLLTPESMVPMVGASGAISGITGAYLLIYPKANIRILFFFYFFWRVFNVPAWVVLGMWFLFQFFGAAAAPADGPGVAFWAHIGGFLAGMLLIKPFLPKGETLFHAPHSRPWEMKSITPKPEQQSIARQHQILQSAQRRRGTWRHIGSNKTPKGPWE